MKARIGMARDELLAACGKPKRISSNFIETAYGQHSTEQFVYSSMNPDDYVYVENGKVRSMQWGN